ncbi:MAG: hypothetical protein HPY61_05845 [Methanotrichaceae archaeon]|nr:hypothetical protein [Methanotrichaceae archaeon]
MKSESKMVLSVQALSSVQKVQAMAVAEMMNPLQPLSNVVGVASGVKWSNGKPTGKPALIILVTQKVEESRLESSDLIPKEIEGVQTDVLAIGYPFAGGCEPAGAGIQILAKKARPAKGGYSVGHYKITAGTISTGVYDILPGGTISPPAHGIGIPAKTYILSNNHVLANSNDASIGDPILQPGPYDGGTNPADLIGNLSRFIPITFEPPTPKAQHNNLVDAALAEAQFHDIDREIYWSGEVRGWRKTSDVPVGTIIKKTGRTTNFTTGRVVAIKATVDVGYSSGKTARFKDQFIATGMSAGGDSGSLVTTLDNIAVGLLFAGSATSTIMNPIEAVRSLLNVEVAEQIL